MLIKSLFLGPITLTFANDILFVFYIPKLKQSSPSGSKHQLEIHLVFIRFELIDI